MSKEHEHCVAQAYEKSEPKTFGRLRYHLFICTDGKDFCGCEQSGSRELLIAIRGELARRRLLAQVKITIMQCRQQGAAGPVMVVHPDGIWYEGLKAGNAAEFVEQQVLKGEPVERFRMKNSPQPVTAVPAHIAADAECCKTDPATLQTPEERAAAGAS